MRDFAQYGIDLDAFMEQVVLPDCPPPIYALAHSMGGAVLLRACHAGRRWFDRIVLCAPMIDLPGRTIRCCRRALLCARCGWIGRGRPYVRRGDQRHGGTGPSRQSC